MPIINLLRTFLQNLLIRDDILFVIFPCLATISGFANPLLTIRKLRGEVVVCSWIPLVGLAYDRQTMKYQQLYLCSDRPIDPCVRTTRSPPRLSSPPAQMHSQSHVQEKGHEPENLPGRVLIRGCSSSSRSCLGLRRRRCIPGDVLLGLWIDPVKKSLKKAHGGRKWWWV